MRTALAAAALAVLASAARAEDLFFTVTDIGRIGTTLVKLNNTPAVISVDHMQRSFIWQAGTPSPLPAEFQAWAINDLGMIAGAAGEGAVQQAAVWTGGELTLLGRFNARATWIVSISNTGRIAGENDAHEGFMRDPGDAGFTALAPFWLRSAPAAVSPSGPIIGTYTGDFSSLPEAFRWTEGGFVAPLGRFGGYDSFGSDINSSGVCVGAARHAARNWTEAVVFEPAGPRGLGSLAEFQESRALAVNEPGDIVGFGVIVQPSRTEHATLWRGGVLHDLNDLIDAPGWILLTATDINDQGHIVGVGRFDGAQHAFLLTPALPPACAPDLTGDGEVDFADYLEFLNLYGELDPRVDFNADGQVDFLDYLEFLNLYASGC